MQLFISIVTFTILTSVGPNDEKKEQQHDVSPWTTFLKVKGCFTLDMRGNNGFSFDKCISSLTLRWGVREDYCHYFGLICILRKEVWIISQKLRCFYLCTETSQFPNYLDFKRPKRLGKVNFCVTLSNVRTSKWLFWVIFKKCNFFSNFLAIDHPRSNPISEKIAIFKKMAISSIENGQMLSSLRK